MVYCSIDSVIEVKIFEKTAYETSTKIDKEKEEGKEVDQEEVEGARNMDISDSSIMNITSESISPFAEKADERV